MKKQYTLFAGVNGAGKTSMYKALYLASESMGYRINTDEIVSSRGGRKEILQIIRAFERGLEDM